MFGDLYDEERETMSPNYTRTFPGTEEGWRGKALMTRGATRLLEGLLRSEKTKSFFSTKDCF